MFSCFFSWFIVSEWDLCLIIYFYVLETAMYLLNILQCDLLFNFASYESQLDSCADLLLRTRGRVVYGGVLHVDCSGSLNAWQVGYSSSRI